MKRLDCVDARPCDPGRYPTGNDAIRTFHYLGLATLTLLAMCVLCGCDRAETESVIITPIPPPRTWEAYARCAPLDAQYKLEFTVRDSHGETHKETFFLRLKTIRGDSYPYHGGGVSSADGRSGGFNRACYIEDGTSSGVAVRFRLTSRHDEHANINLNELVWATIGRRTAVDLPHDCHAILEFVELGSD